jgi:surfactin synthase thioesterase subunit/glycosyltransferase involved in cell wall biosynthesis
MRILLAQNSLYFPAHGGGDKSNRLLVEALAARGHECLAVARTGPYGESYAAELAARGVAARDAHGAIEFERARVRVRVAAGPGLRAYFAQQIRAFRPDIILASTDDPAQVLLEPALQSPAPVVFLARATLALPFGPDSAFPSETKTARLRQAAAVVGVSEYVANYIQRHSGIPAMHVPISLMEPEEWPNLGRFGNEFVTMVNPCAVKGIAIFLALADAFPHTRFAAVPSWGTGAEDRAALEARRNITLLGPVDDINILLRRTSVLLVPSLWAEARSRMVVEAMLRGIPVMAANTGGLPEAKMGVPYLLPVNPITKYQPRLDKRMVPVAEVPRQDIAPWRAPLAFLLSNRSHYETISRDSRAAALNYARYLTVQPFEELLVRNAGARRANAAAAAAGRKELTPEKRRLLAIRLRQRSPATVWFPGAEAAAGMRLFWFPHAGAGQSGAAPLICAGLPGTAVQAKDQDTSQPQEAGQGAGPRTRGAAPPGLPRVCPVRLPGRESRLAEAPFERMGPLIQALAAAIETYLDQRFAFFGHSMGAAVAFELARELRRRDLPAPKVLIASAARAPQFRRNHTPPPEPSDEELLREAELPDDAAVRHGILPALRADTALYRHYVYTEDAPLPFPIRAYGGAADPHITREHLEAWREQTTASFALRLFPGGHFYLRTAQAEFVAALREDLNLL